MHKTIDTVGRDYAGLWFNTAIARLIELNNALTKLDAVPREAAEKIVLMVAPLAPHIAEELWARLGHEGAITFVPFPQPDAGAARRGHGDVRRADQGQGARPGRGAG